VRSAAAPESLIKEVEDAVSSLDPDLPLVDVRTAQQGIDRTLWAPRLTTVLLTLFGFLALALATLGVYSVTAVTAARRKTEIGIRMALGAGHLRVVRLFVLRGLATIVAGTCCGLLGAATLVRWFESSLLGIATGSALSFISVASALTIAGACATAIPSLRAARADPARSLLGE
jgi:ABC-type antimicrobial peptide transport system permease subunit